MLTPVDVIAQSFALLGPVTVVAFATNLVAGSAGAATPLAMLLAGLICVAIGYVVAQFAQRVHAAGCVYDYIDRSFGHTPGSVAGWMYLCALSLFCPGIVCGISGWIAEFLAKYAHLTVPWYAIVLALCVPLHALVVFDIRVATRTQLAISFASVAIVMLLVLWILLRGGQSGHSLAPFLAGSAQRGWHGLSFGLIFAMTIFAGFESAATLAEETANPKRAMPIAIIGSVTLAAGFYVIVTYAYAIGFGVRGGEQWGKDATVLLTMANRYAGTWLVPIVFLAAIVDAFAVGLGCLNGSARVCYAMARSGVLPRPLSRTHSRHQTPHIASGTILLATAVIGLPFAFVRDGAILAFAYLGGIAGIILQIIYIVLAIAAMVYFRRHLAKEYSFARHTLAPVVAILGCLGALYGSLQPPPGTLFVTMPYAAAMIIAAGFLFGRRGRKDERGDQI